MPSVTPKKFRLCLYRIKYLTRNSAFAQELSPGIINASSKEQGLQGSLTETNDGNYGTFGLPEGPPQLINTFLVEFDAAVFVRFIRLISTDFESDLSMYETMVVRCNNSTETKECPSDVYYTTEAIQHRSHQLRFVCEDSCDSLHLVQTSGALSGVGSLLMLAEFEIFGYCIVDGFLNQYSISSEMCG